MALGGGITGRVEVSRLRIRAVKRNYGNAEKAHLIDFPVQILQSRTAISFACFDHD